MGKVFKQSMMGFNKEQVIAYIDALVEKQKTVLAAEKEKYNQLLEENEKITAEKDEAIESIKAELTEKSDELTSENEKITTEKSELFESLKSVKSQLNELQNTNTELQRKATELENSLSIEKIKVQNAEKRASEAGALKTECEKMRADIAQLEAEAKKRSARVNVLAKKAVQTEDIELSEKAEVLWENFKVKINDLAEEFSELSETVRQTDNQPKINKTLSIKDILDKVKRIGDKL